MIEMGKKYRYKNGEKAIILTVNRPQKYSVISMNSVGEILSHKEDGTSGVHGMNWDLVEVSPYEDFKIDEPVVVRDSDQQQWTRAHFAGVSPNGRPMSWCGGTTSWTHKVDPIVWLYCKKVKV